MMKRVAVPDAAVKSRPKGFHCTYSIGQSKANRGEKHIHPPTNCFIEAISSVTCRRAKNQR